MSGPILALRAAIHRFLSADSELMAMLEGRPVLEEASRHSLLPYATFGEARARNATQGEGSACEQFCTIHVWSDPSSRIGLDIAERMAVRLDDAALELEGFILVSIDFVSIETRRENNGRLLRSSLRLRAFTEQA